VLLAKPFNVIVPVEPPQTVGFVLDIVPIIGAGLITIVVDELDCGQPGTVAVTV
jgi:hypothetical protein